MARETIYLTHTCGCRVRSDVRYDGRSKKARQAAIDREIRISGCDDACHSCRHAALAAEFGETLAATGLPAAWLRAVQRVARLTGGTISVSPKSCSTYVTWPAGAWRISNHAWPGAARSLCRERAGGRYGQRHTSRLTADWLVVELAGK